MLSAAIMFAGFDSANSTSKVSKSIVVAIVGQSNEVGAGDSPDPNVPLSSQRDPVPPNGGRRSMWPTLEQIAAEHNVRMWTWNSAVGSSSIAYGWAGSLSRWQRGMIVSPGHYVLWHGRIYANRTPQPKNVLSQSMREPSVPTSADGLLWEDMGPAGPSDRPGRVYRPGDRLFDPNGFVRTAISGLSRQRGERWVFISIGQGDAGNYWEVTREQYANGLIAVTEAGLNAGARVAVGFTCASAKPAVEEAYQAKLLPGWRDALAHFNGDRRVIAGANLREALGELQITTDGRPGLKADRLHMNDNAYSLASLEWARVLQQAGVFPAH